MRTRKQVSKRPGGSTLDEDQITTVLSDQRDKEKCMPNMQQQPMVLGYDCDDDDPEDDDQSQ